MNKLLTWAACALLAGCAATPDQPVFEMEEPVDYVNTLMGTQSKFALSTGNTYPAVALPWGMNFWTPQTGTMGDGWTYTYDADKIRTIFPAGIGRRIKGLDFENLSSHLDGSPVC